MMVSFFLDDTYMYDDDVRALAPHHWYDEPPYESDPEDFLMGLGNCQQTTTATTTTANPSATATLQNGRFVEFDRVVVVPVR